MGQVLAGSCAKLKSQDLLTCSLWQTRNEGANNLIFDAYSNVCMHEVGYGVAVCPLGSSQHLGSSLSSNSIMEIRPGLRLLQR